MEKMSTWSFYDPDTGLLSGVRFSGPASILPENTPSGHRAVEGRHDHLSCRVDLKAGHVVDWQPPQPSAEHEWNPDIKRWQLGAAALKRREVIARISELEHGQERAIREALLGRADAMERLEALDVQIAMLRAQLS